MRVSHISAIWSYDLEAKASFSAEKSIDDGGAIFFSSAEELFLLCGNGVYQGLSVSGNDGPVCWAEWTLLTNTFKNFINSFVYIFKNQGNSCNYFPLKVSLITFLTL